MEVAELPDLETVGGDALAVPVELMRRAADALQGLVVEDLTGRELGELLVGIHRQEARVLAGTLDAVRAFEQRPYWQTQGAKSAARWLAQATRAPLRAMHRLTRLARRLPQMPHTRAALAAGDICGDHAEVLAKVAGSPRRIVREAFGGAEEGFVADATQRSFEDFDDTVGIWQNLIDEDGAEQTAGADREDRHLHLSQTFRGNWVLRGRLDPVAGEEVAEALRRIDDELFEADWAAAKAIHGTDTRPEDLARTPAQRHQLTPTREAQRDVERRARRRRLAGGDVVPS